MRSKSWLLAAIAIIAFALRLVYLNQIEASPLTSVLMGDGRVYDEWAMRIAGGEWMGKDVFYQTPFYPYFLGVVYAVAGHDPAIARIVQAVLGAASCVLLGLAGRRFFSARDGAIAASLLAIYPPAIFFDGLIQKSSLDLFLMTAILALLAEFQTRRRWTWLAAAGTAAGALVLNRENAFVLLPVVAAWLLAAFKDVPWRTRAAWAAAFAGAALLVLLPVGLRNYHVGGAFTLTTTQLGPNFYIGNNPNASGSYESLLSGRGDAIYEREDATAIASQAAGRPLSPAEVSRYWLGRSFDYIREQPLDWLRRSGRKLLLTVNAAEISDTESIEAYAEFAPLLAGLRWLDFGVVLPLAAFGAWMCRRDWRRHLLLYLMAAGMIVAVAAFYVVARYRHPIAPVVMLFAGAGVGSLVQLRHTRREWIPACVAAAVVAVVAHLPMNVVHDQTYVNLGGYFARNGRPADAVPLLTKAVSLDPGDASAHAHLGLALRETGQVEPAADEFGAAVRLRPGDFAFRMYYAAALCQLYRATECLAQYAEAERLDPRSIDAPLFTARAHAMKGDLPAAFASLEKALRIANETNQPERAKELAEIIRQTKIAMGQR